MSKKVGFEVLDSKVISKEGSNENLVWFNLQLYFNIKQYLDYCNTLTGFVRVCNNQVKDNMSTCAAISQFYL